MNARVKQLWMEALRNGEYPQGTGYLYRDGKYCCLGVLCDLHSKETGTKWVLYPDERNIHLYLNSRYGLPLEVVQWSGLTLMDPVIDGFTLSSYNDGVENNGIPFTRFPEMADLIENAL